MDVIFGKARDGFVDWEGRVAPRVDAAGAYLFGAILHRAQMPNSDFSLAGLSTAILTEVDFTGVTLARASMRDVCGEGGRFDRADMFGVDAKDSSFAGASFRQARLVGGVFFGADFTGADFSGADVRGADLRGTTLEARQLMGAFVDAGTLLDPEVWNEVLPSAEARAAFRGVLAADPRGGLLVELLDMADRVTES